MDACLEADYRQSGLEPIGHLPWGSHFCQFYSVKQDLIDTLVPYFAAGLRDDELCVWVTSDVLEREEAEERLRGALPDFDERKSKGQIEFHDHRDWYLRGGSLKGVLDQWLHKEAEALERGFAGLRLTGDTSFVERSGWDDFVEYERLVNAAFGRFRLVALCTYPASRCTASDVLDVMSNHQYALARRAGDWQIIEHPTLKTSKEELERRVLERTRALEEAVRGRDEFLAMLGHELRNPLAPIRNAAELVMSVAADRPQLIKIGEMISRQARHMGRMLDDLLDVARLTHGRISLELQHADLAAIVSQAVENATPAAETRGHRLRLELAAGALPVLADTTRLAQVIDNLLDNAIKYTPKHGEIEVRVSRADEPAAIVSVSDSGIGIAAESLPTVFDLFTQEKQQLDRAQGGLGLGLAMVRMLVEMHGGSVSARSAGRDRGATFEVRLPLGAAPSTGRPDSGARDRGTTGRRVLVVDDNRDAAESLAMLLSLRGHDVRTAHDGPSALEAAQAFAPSIVILDIGLPGMDGHEVARRMRARPELAAAKLIAVTGYGQRDDRESTREAGFDAHLVKPVELETLERHISAPRAEPA